MEDFSSPHVSVGSSPGNVTSSVTGTDVAASPSANYLGRSTDVLAVTGMFPDLDPDVVASVVAMHGENVNEAINQLLSMQAGEPVRPSTPEGLSPPNSLQKVDDEAFARQYQRALRNSVDGTVDEQQVAREGTRSHLHLTTQPAHSNSSVFPRD